MSFRARRTLAVPSADLHTRSGTPRRTPIGKEEREGLLLEELRKSGRLDFPKGLIRRGADHTGKGPDFVIESLPGRTVAVELTELYSDDARSPGAGSPEREQEGLREQFVRKAEHAFYDIVPDGRAVNVSFHWLPEGFGAATLTPKLVKKLAPGAADLIVRRMLGAAGALAEVGKDELEAAELGTFLVSIQGREAPPYPDGRASPWCHSGPPFSPAALGVAPVERAIASKEAKLAGYRTWCDEAWLLLASAGGPSSPDVVGDAVVDCEFRSEFDRVVLFCSRADPNRRVLILV